MKLTDIRDFPEKSVWLKMADLENMFEVSVDKKQKYVYNLNETLCFAGSNNNLKLFKLDHDMFWTLASYKLYGTTRYAWLLMKLNNVDGDHIFDQLHAGDVIKYIDTGSIQQVQDMLAL